MPFQITPEIDFAAVGLVTDIPAHRLPQGAWSDCLNMRVKDKSVQGVNVFEDSFAITGEPYAITQWTPTGIDDLYIAYIFKDAFGNGRVAVFNETNGETVDITNDNSDAAFTLDDKYPPQIFVFNDLLVVNPATGNPQYMQAETIFKRFNSPLTGSIDATASTSVVGVGTLFTTELVAGNSILVSGEERVVATIVDDLTLTITVAFTSLVNDTSIELGGVRGSLIDLPNWIVYPATYSIQSDIDAGNVYDYFGTLVTSLNQWLTVVPAIARVLKPFKSRLVALSLLNDKDTSTNTDDVKFPADWNVSTVIVTADSLQSVDWNATFVNDVDYGVLTQTPGKILDGSELGDSFIIYKSDSVIKMSYTGDTNNPFRFETITEDDGIYSARCVASIGDQMHLVVGNYGVYMIDANGQREHIAKGIFQETLFDLIYAPERERAFAFHQTRDKEVWLCLSSVDNVDPITLDRLKGCNIAFVWNYETSSLHIRSLPNVTSIYETELDGELAIYAASPSSSTLLKLSNDTLEPNGFFNRINDPVGDATVIKQVKSIHIASEGNLKIAVSGVFNTLEVPTYSDSSFNPSTDFKVDTRAQGRYLSMRVSMDGVNNPKLTTMQFDFRPTGKR